MDSDNIYNFSGPQIPLHSPISMYYILIANHTHACIFLIDRDLQMDIYIYTYINTQIYMLCHMHVHTLERVEQTNKTNKQKQNRKRRYMKKKLRNEPWVHREGEHGREWIYLEKVGSGGKKTVEQWYILTQNATTSATMVSDLDFLDLADIGF